MKWSTEFNNSTIYIVTKYKPKLLHMHTAHCHQFQFPLAFAPSFFPLLCCHLTGLSARFVDSLHFAIDSISHCIFCWMKLHSLFADNLFTWNFCIFLFLFNFNFDSFASPAMQPKLGWSGMVAGPFFRNLYDMNLSASLTPHRFTDNTEWGLTEEDGRVPRPTNYVSFNHGGISICFH